MADIGRAKGANALGARLGDDDRDAMTTPSTCAPGHWQERHEAQWVHSSKLGEGTCTTWNAANLLGFAAFQAAPHSLPL